MGDWLSERLHGKVRTFHWVMCVYRKATLSPSDIKEPIGSPFSWIKRASDWTQHSSVRFMDGLCPSQVCDTEPWRGCGCSLISFYKLSAAPGTALRYILYFSLAYLSALRWCPIASMAMIMYMVSSVCLSVREWSPVALVTYHISRPFLYVSSWWLWNVFSPVTMPLILLHTFVELDCVWADYAWVALSLCCCSVLTFASCFSL